MALLRRPVRRGRADAHEADSEGYKKVPPRGRGKKTQPPEGARSRSRGEDSDSDGEDPIPAVGSM